MNPKDIKKLNLTPERTADKFAKYMEFTGFLELHADKYVRVRPAENSNDYLSFKVDDVLSAVATDEEGRYKIRIREGATAIKAVREFGTVDRTNIAEFIKGGQRSVIRVFSPRLNDYIDVPLVPSNARDEQLAGMMPVMLVTDNPLSLSTSSTEEGWEPIAFDFKSKRVD